MGRTNIPKRLYVLYIEWKKASLPEFLVFSSDEKRNDFVFDLVRDTWPEEVDDRGPWEIMDAMEEAGHIAWEADDVWLDLEAPTASE